MPHVLVLLALIFPLTSCSEISSSSNSLESSSLSSLADYTVSYHAGEGGTITGETTQTITEGGNASEVIAVPLMDYQFTTWSDGLLTASRTDENVSANLDLTASFALKAEDSLPIIRINTVSSAPIASDIIYTSAVVSIESDLETYSLGPVSAGIRLRGHSTQTMPKKPYRIKFSDKQGLFGKTKAKSWVLLADYLDPSKLHNFTAFTMGNSFNHTSYQPMAKHVRVILNGSDDGIYLCTQQVDEKPGRVDIEMEIFESTIDYNFLVCMDNWASTDPSEILNETYFNLDMGGTQQSFVIKYPEETDFPSPAQYHVFFNWLKDYYADIISAFASQNYASIASKIDVDSLVDITLIDQIMNEPDHFFTSYYMSKRVGEKLMFGPTWDYDLSLGYDEYTGQPYVNYDYTLVTDVHFNNFFCWNFGGTANGMNDLNLRWNEVGNDAIDNYLEWFGPYVAFLEPDLQSDADRWYDGNHQMVEDNLEYLYNWMDQRKAAMNAYY